MSKCKPTSQLGQSPAGDRQSRSGNAAADGTDAGTEPQLVAEYAVARDGEQPEQHSYFLVLGSLIITCI